MADTTDRRPRKIKFKAWNTETRLLMRLNSIDCQKGELVKKNHILLQYTGLDDVEGNEIYDADVLLIGYDQYTVFWEESQSGWYYAPVTRGVEAQPFVASVAARMRRFCSGYELQKA